MKKLIKKLDAFIDENGAAFIMITGMIILLVAIAVAIIFAP